MQLTSDIASLRTVVESGFRGVTERIDELKDKVQTTNGRVTDLERRDIDRSAVERTEKMMLSQASSRTPVVAKSVVTLAEIKWWIAIAVGCLGAGAYFTVWILTLVGKL